MKLFKNLPTSTLDIVRRTIEVSDTEDGDVVVSFHTARGRGTSPVTLAASEYDELVSALSFYVENGVNRSDETRSPADMVRETISIDDGVVSFRTRAGRGSRPTRINESEFAAVVALLADSSESIQEAVTEIRGKIVEAAANATATVES
jgi:hypothetical protein